MCPGEVPPRGSPPIPWCRMGRTGGEMTSREAGGTQSRWHRGRGVGRTRSAAPRGERGKTSRALKALKAPSRVAAWSPSRRRCLNRILPLFLAGHPKSLRDPVSRVRSLPNGSSFYLTSPLLPHGGRRWVPQGGPSPRRDNVLSLLGWGGRQERPPSVGTGTSQLTLAPSFSPHFHPRPENWVWPHFAGPRGSPGVALNGARVGQVVQRGDAGGRNTRPTPPAPSALTGCSSPNWCRGT